MSPNVLSLNEQSKVLLIAPHPDDESLACSIILQRAVRAQAALRVIYATDGDNNPWPQRVLQRKWRLTPSDRAEWGLLRREEAIQALTILGVRRSDVEFLALPDQGVTELLLSDCEPTLNRLASYISEWAPTHIFCPDINDIHPDHSALGVMLRVILERLQATGRNHAMWSFLVHGSSVQFFNRAVVVSPTAAETEAKLRAINCHRTQLKLSRRRFTSYALRPEQFAAAEFNFNSLGHRSIEWQDNSHLVMNVAAGPNALFRSRPKLFLFGHGPSGESRALCVRLHRADGSLEMFDGATGECVGIAEVESCSSAKLQVAVPKNLFSRHRGVYLKLERRGFFFDAAGWLQTGEELNAAHPAPGEVPMGLSLALS